ncbi:uncharacterized protein LOC110248550 [Exaiptasia diaphana]|uniref:L-serine deaminase n=1 Tax=Exaiptasia diaphana TaxID=2652724 RepID=A0A913XW19_EXADI|nr:uncharacterized protein LOC110248550 [Exaiptasia diaphana]KXJ08609.1 L-threonine dehydratase catabolic TdcB [Exaiptasia diaphana]
MDSLPGKCIEASKRIRPHVRHTPMDYSYWLSSLNSNHVYIKWESEQISGSAKARGAFNKLMAIKERNPEIKEAIVASTGNHGAACSLAMKILGINGKVYVPTMVEKFKYEMIQQYGSTAEIQGEGCAEAESLARAYSEANSIPYISPSNDWDVLAGQGVIGCEIFEDLPSVDAVFISVGGGGIVAGVGAYIKSVKPDCKIIGCETIQSPAMSESQKAGYIVEVPNKPTLSDGTAGGVEKGNITFDICKEVVDDWVIVTEEEIAKAIYNVMEHHHKIVEGSAGLAIAAYIKTMSKYKGKNVVVLSCGSNISVNRIKDIINTYG